jgi:hypothetical protein
VKGPSSPDHSLDVDPSLLANLSLQESANADDQSWNVKYFRRFHVVLKAGTFQMDSECEIIGDGSSTQRNTTIYDALRYLVEVKLQYMETPYVYNSFLDILKDFQTHV